MIKKKISVCVKLHEVREYLNWVIYYNLTAHIEREKLFMGEISHSLIRITVIDDVEEVGNVIVRWKEHNKDIEIEDELEEVEDED